MMMLSAEEALASYEAVRHRLPPASDTPCAPRRIGALTDVADEFDVFLLDAFGVLNVGERAIPGTVDRIAALRRAGKRVLVVSNAASEPVSAQAGKYRRMGYDFPESDIVTSRATLAASLNGRHALHWGMMAGKGARIDDFPGIRTSPLGEDPDLYETVEGFLLIGSASWNEERQILLERALAARPRPVLVGNPDIVAPREDGFSVEPGHFAHRLADRTGVEPEFFGKPFANIFRLAFERLESSDRGSRILMVGDSLHTDILGAQGVGIAAALVTGHGFFADRDVDEIIRDAGIYPDFVLQDP